MPISDSSDISDTGGNPVISEAELRKLLYSEIGQERAEELLSAGNIEQIMSLIRVTKGGRIPGSAGS